MQPSNSKYEIHTNTISKPLRIVVLSDLHSRTYSKIDGIVKLAHAQNPDLVLMPGDIFERLDGSRGEWKAEGYELIRRVSEFAPVFYSIGNHENGGVRSANGLKWKLLGAIPKYYDDGELSQISQSGATVLDDEFVIWNGIAIGGLTSGIINEGHEPHLDWLDVFCECDGAKILLCHHPEYYEKHLKEKNIDLIVSGHAHGGQWRFFGKGIYAPGQGLFPKYTSGVYDNRLVVSRGLKPARYVPRFFNPPEIVTIDIK